MYISFNDYNEVYAKQLYQRNKNTKVLNIDEIDLSVKEAENIIKELQEKIDYLKK